MPPANGSRTDLLPFRTSAGNATLQTYSPKKCAMGPISADFAIPSCLGPPTSSNTFLFLSALRQNLVPPMPHKRRATFHPHALVLSTSCSRIPSPERVTHSPASLLPAGISYHVLLEVFPAGSYERSYGGCQYDTPTSYRFTKFSYVN